MHLMMKMMWRMKITEEAVEKAIETAVDLLAEEADALLTHFWNRHMFSH